MGRPPLGCRRRARLRGRSLADRKGQLHLLAGTHRNDGERLADAVRTKRAQQGVGAGHGLPGPASLSTKHTLALTNRGGARAEDLLALAREVRGGVRAAFGVELEVEPTLVGCAL